ncbi:threonine ammonia-lyase [Pandoraea sputorum]|uniref:threonine ammonia-lyase n=1 Tax=Pandoraea sputorum TaxID=93222 RepID=UPI00123F1208|nr:threonine/serine dehydratase [Pandoraea sputorum]VVE75332.1 serine dehydratase [Pandoraea sputorum]
MIESINSEGIVDRLETASARISSFIQTTPLLKSDYLNDRLQCNLFIKAENLQRTGSFKIRGALNKTLASTSDESASHLLTWSSGNHGAALAEVAQDLGIPASVVVPPWIPQVKVDNILSRGASVYTASDTQDVVEMGKSLAARLGAVVIPAYDDISVIDGQATVTLELLSQFSETNNGSAPDALIYPCGGGSLIAGAALVVGHSPIALLGAEPTAAADTKRSLLAGEPCEAPDVGITICDALRNRRPGALTFDLMRQSVRDVLLVDDACVEAAMRVLFRHFKLVTEPGGAIAFAAVLSEIRSFRDKSVVAVISGGNVSHEQFAKVIQADNEVRAW